MKSYTSQKKKKVCWDNYGAYNSGKKKLNIFYLKIYLNNIFLYFLKLIFNFNVSKQFKNKINN
jgi:hypothetical protein